MLHQSTPTNAEEIATICNYTELPWCEIEPGQYLLNASLCRTSRQTFPSEEIVQLVPDYIYNEKKLEIRMGPGTINCRWDVFLLYYHGFLTVTVEQLTSQATNLRTAGNLSILSLQYQEMDTKFSKTVDMAQLLHKDLIITSPVTLHFYLKGEAPHLVDYLVLRAWFNKGQFIRQLPVVKLSKTSGYVSTPNYDGVFYRCPGGYAGQFQLKVATNHSVFITFSGECSRLILRVGSHIQQDLCDGQQAWYRCSHVYRDTILIDFDNPHSTKHILGFKMTYALVPQKQEPVQVAGGLYNCSVPHFETFAPVLQCNMVVECASGEDERDCDFYSEDCGVGWADSGSKCYRLVQHRPGIFWSEAYSHCLQHNEQLITLATPAEIDFFKRMLSLKKTQNPYDYVDACVYVGIDLTSGMEFTPTVAKMYRHIWRWLDGRSAFYANIKQTSDIVIPLCASHVFTQPPDIFLQPHLCTDKLYFNCDFFCAKDKANMSDSIQLPVLQPNAELPTAAWKVKTSVCNDGHVTRDFLSCDHVSWCPVEDYNMASCQRGEVEVPMFVCEQSMETVHYTLVCDHFQHCPDNTDEDFCEFDPCPALSCQNGQCLTFLQNCNGQDDCWDFSDEQNCVECQNKYTRTVHSFQPPFVVNLDLNGFYTQTQMKNSSDCPNSHFLCSGGICLPIFLRCNGVDDCPGREDEQGCETYTCPGYYRCWQSKMCLSPGQLCDNVSHCPQQDDEMLCDLQCPDVCKCQGLAFVCFHSFNASSYSSLRLLDASGSDTSLDDIKANKFLIYARLSHCNIKTVQKIHLINLRHLDLSNNLLRHVYMEHFIFMKNLRVLLLSGNPLMMIARGSNDFSADNIELHTLDLSQTHLQVYDGTVLACCPKLQSINMSWSPLTRILDVGFQSTPDLKNLDTRNSPLSSFPFDVLRNLQELRTVYTDNYKLCCPALLPSNFDLKNCQAKFDLLASCEDLLKSDAYRIFLWIFAALAVVGNLSSFVARVYLDVSGLCSFGVFVTNMNIADLFMGIYLAIVGTADLVYHGRYLYHDLQWKTSKICSTAGFFSLLSSEVSAFSICLITLDRFLVLRFPFSQIHFNRRSALFTCGCIWTLGFILSAVPLLPATSHWQFFSQTGICIPFPFTSSKSFYGYKYSFSVMIVLNFILFVVIACGQAVIYWSVQANMIASVNTNIAVRHATVARRLTTIVVTDFLCWFPVGLLGGLASTGILIPDELNVAVAIFVLPINSALNPFLYTLNVLVEKQRKAQETKLLKILQSRFEQEHQ